MFAKQKYCQTVFLIIFMMVSTISYGQGFEWVDLPHTYDVEMANSLAVDSTNHFVYMGGGLTSTPLGGYGLIFGSTYGGLDGLVAKYDFDGNVIWAFNIGGSNDDEVTGITIDTAGNIYITGYYSGSINLTGAIFSGVSGFVSTSFGGTDIFIASYTPDGGLRFYQIFGSTGDDAGIDICANQSTVFITGFYTNSININGQPSTVPYNNKNIFVAALDYAGIFLWTTDAGSDADDFSSTPYQQQNMGIAADNNSVYIIGMMGGSNFIIFKDDGTLEDTLFNNDSYQNIFILSIESVSGYLEWAQKIENNTDPVGGMDIAVNSEGVYITGMCHNNSIFPGGNIVSAPSNSFVFFSKLDNITGTEEWTKSFWGDSTNNDVGYAIAADNNHGIYITGKYRSDPFNFDIDAVLNNADQEEAFFVKYSDDGNFGWVINANGPNDETGLDIVPFNDEIIFVAGIYSEDIYFPPYHSESTGDIDNLFVGKLLAKSGFQFDDSGCMGDVDSNGVIMDVNGSGNLTVEPCQHVQICETIYVMDNLGNGWLDSLTFELGSGFTNISDISPDGTDNGFYENGNWLAQYNSGTNSIYWYFDNTGTNPDYGDGYIYNSTYSCADGTPHEYHFCFEANIAQNASDSDLAIGISIYDDGWSSGNGIITMDYIHINELTVIDPPPYFISCPNDTVVGTGFGNTTCSVNVDWNPPIANDNCPPTVTQIEGLPPGSAFSTGVHLISYVTIDDNGNTDTCSFTITVLDNTPPVINCQADQVKPAQSNNCSYIVQGTEFDPVNYFDNCSPVSIYNNINGNTTLNNQILPLGDHQIIWFAVDSMGNIASCSFNVSIIDTTLPVVSCPSNQTASANLFCNYAVQGQEFDPIYYNDDCSNVTLSNNINSDSSLAGELLPLGLTGITWTVMDDFGNTNSCTFTITVVDNTPPSVTCPSDQNRPTSATNCYYTTQGTEFDLLNVSDNCGVYSISNNINGTNSLNGQQFSPGDYDIVWIVTDNAGNIDSCGFMLSVYDETPPFVDCVGPQTRYITGNLCSYTTQGQEFDPINYGDNCSVASVLNDYSGTVTLDGTVFPAGNTTVIWTVTDNTGLTDSCQLTITVIDTISPEITCQTDRIIYLDSTHCSYTVQGNEFDPVFYNDNCTNIDLSNNLNGDTTLTGEVLPVGQYSITWTITDPTGNIDSCTFLVMIIDTTAPVFDWPQDIVTCDSIVTWNTPNAYDNCSAVSVIQTGNTQFSSGSVFPSGTTTIEYTATDSSGNSQIASFNIIVLPPLYPYWSGFPAEICLYDSPVELNNLITGDTGGIWLGTGIIGNEFNPTAAGIGTHAITYHLDNGYCTADSILTILVTNVPSVDAGESLQICGKESTLSGNTEAPVYFWTTVQGGILFNPDSTNLNPMITVPDFGTYQFILTAEESSNCFNKDTVSITFFEMPQNVFAGDDQTLNVVDETQLHAQSPDYGTGYWSFYQGSGVIVDSTLPESFVSQLAEDENILIWTVVNGPCKDSDQVSIFVNPLLLPDAFSPNGDGFNDYFVIMGISDFQNELTVFNRWGKEVYHQVNYRNDWNGTTANSKDLPEDTYFYILTIDGKNYHGSITLSR